jgi:pimeloyl-ACP methyl ester carboxylesterase
LRRRLARWGSLIAASLLALIAAVTIAAGIYVWVTPGGESAHALYGGPFVRVDGRELAYRQWGTHGSPIVLIGGFIEGTDVWRRTAPLLARTHRVYAVDLPPFGYSERKGPYVLSTWIDEVEGFERALHIEQPTLVGHSLGAAVVAGEALRRPSAVHSIVLLDGDALRGGGAPSWVSSLIVDPYYTALYRFITTSDWIFRIGLKSAYGPTAPHFSAAEIEGWQRPFRVNGTTRAFKEVISHGIQGLTLDDLARVRVPAAVVWGEHDTTDEVTSGRMVAGVLHAPFVLLPRVGHLSMLADPSGVARAVERAAAPDLARRR